MTTVNVRMVGVTRALVPLQNIRTVYRIAERTRLSAEVNRLCCPPGKVSVLPVSPHASASTRECIDGYLMCQWQQNKEPQARSIHLHAEQLDRYFFQSNSVSFLLQLYLYSFWQKRPRDLFPKRLRLSTCYFAKLFLYFAKLLVVVRT